MPQAESLENTGARPFQALAVRQSGLSPMQRSRRFCRRHLAQLRGLVLPRSKVFGHCARTRRFVAPYEALRLPAHNGPPVFENRFAFWIRLEGLAVSVDENSFVDHRD